MGLVWPHFLRTIAAYTDPSLWGDSYRLYRDIIGALTKFQGPLLLVACASPPGEQYFAAKEWPLWLFPGGCPKAPEASSPARRDGRWWALCPPQWPLAKNIKTNLLYFSGDKLWDITNVLEHSQDQAEARNLPENAPLHLCLASPQCSSAFLTPSWEHFLKRSLAHDPALSVCFQISKPKQPCASVG